MSFYNYSKIACGQHHSIAIVSGESGPYLTGWGFGRPGGKGGGDPFSESTRNFYSKDQTRYGYGQLGFLKEILPAQLYDRGDLIRTNYEVFSKDGYIPPKVFVNDICVPKPWIGSTQGYNGYESTREAMSTFAINSDKQFNVWGTELLDVKIGNSIYKSGSLEASIVCTPTFTSDVRASKIIGNGAYLLLVDGTVKNILRKDVNLIPNYILNSKQIADIGVGSDHAIVLNKNGYISGFGSGSFALMGITQVIKTAGFSTYLHSLKTGSVVIATGTAVYNNPILKNQGQLLIPGSIQGNVTGISVGLNHNVALLANGGITGWGGTRMISFNNNGGGLNHDNTITFGYDNSLITYPSSIFGKIKKVICMNQITDILLFDGTVTGFGFEINSKYFYLEDGTINNKNILRNTLYSQLSGQVEDFDSSTSNGLFLLKNGLLTGLKSYRKYTDINFDVRGDKMSIVGIPKYNQSLNITGINPSFSSWFSIGNSSVQTISNILYDKFIADGPFALNATSSDNNNIPIRYFIRLDGRYSANLVTGNLIASIDTNQGIVTPKAQGTVIVSMSKAANYFYNLMTSGVQIPIYSRKYQDLSFSLPNVLNIQEHQNYTLDGRSSSNFPVSYSGYDTNLLEINNFGIMTIKNPGTTQISVIQTGNKYYYSGIPVTKTLTTIPYRGVQDNPFISGTFDFNFGDPIYFFPSQSSLILPITYTSSNQSIVDIAYKSGIVIRGTGECLIQASNSDTDYVFGMNYSANIQVTRRNQTITFPSIPSQKFRKSIFYITGSSDSYLKINYLISDSGIANIVNQNGIKMLKTGTFQISGTEPGNGYYEAATPVVRNFTILKGTQTIKL